ncbi:MAG TPA: FtsX-like permease family protein [Cyclobacteriaceae bacterium]|nr:FtsX-like permease family protein [Cyclobacteriaceae bacterium]
MPNFQSRLFFRIVSANREVYGLKIVTLAIAFASSTLIVLFSLNEFGYDRFHRDSNAIFRVLQRNGSETVDGNRLSTRIPYEIFTSLKYAPDSLVVSRVKILDNVSIRTDSTDSDLVKIHAADPSIVNIFSFATVAGTLTEFQKKERTALLSAGAAQHYFGTAQAVGKKLKIYSLGDTVLFTVAAVFKDYPQNSHEEFNVFIRFDARAISLLGFNPGDAGVYGRVQQGNSATHEVVINELAKQDEFDYHLQPVTEIYFGPRVAGEDARHGDHYSVLILICITGLILCLALTSFINLTTLTLPHRSKEIAVKKMAGTSQWNLGLTFLYESFAITGIAMALGILLLLATSGMIDSILSIRVMPMLSNGDGAVWMILTGLLMFTGIAPLFLTFRFTRASPNRLLSTDTITFPRLKRIITILQLGVGLFLIVASMVIRRQVNYSLIKEPGRNYYQIVYLAYPKDLTGEGLRNLQFIWSNGRGNPHLLGVIGTSQLPDRMNSKELHSEFYSTSVDPAFLDFFGLKMIQGRWFKPNDGDSISVVNPRGQEVLHGQERNVVGVMEDMSRQFNQPEKPVKVNIAPYFNYNFLCVRVMEVDIRKTVRFLSRSFGSDEQPVSISFINRRFEQWLTYQDKLNVLSEVLTAISGLLACCAIYGLSLSLVRDKLKQIAIHKLFGATTVNITRILILEFAQQMLVAILIFGPFTYIFLKEWLRNFAFSTPFNWLDPLIPLGYCAMIITLLCGFQALGLNRTDLTSSLRG